MNDLKTKILEILRKNPSAGLATITEDGKPWVRTVTVWAADNLVLRFCTDAGSRKARQIEKNPEVHLNCGVLDPPNDSAYLQIQGFAEISKDPKEKEAHWREGWLKYFRGPQDPEYVIAIVRPYRIEYIGPGALKPEIWTAGEANSPMPI